MYPRCLALLRCPTLIPVQADEGDLKVLVDARTVKYVTFGLVQPAAFLSSLGSATLRYLHHRSDDGGRRKSLQLCTPMTPQAARPPALPVLRDSSLSPLPRSSVPYTTMGTTSYDAFRQTSTHCMEDNGTAAGVVQVYASSTQIPSTYPTTLSGPLRVTKESSIVNLASPCASLWMLPRSPTWRDVSLGAPCILLKGLKCDPAEAHPEDRSPPVLFNCSGTASNVLLYDTHWIWKPLCALGSRPCNSPVIVTFALGALWTRVTVPLAP